MKILHEILQLTVIIDNSSSFIFIEKTFSNIFADRSLQTIYNVFNYVSKIFTQLKFATFNCNVFCNRIICILFIFNKKFE